MILARWAALTVEYNNYDDVTKRMVSFLRLGNKMRGLIRALQYDGYDTSKFIDALALNDDFESQSRRDYADQLGLWGK